MKKRLAQSADEDKVFPEVKEQFREREKKKKKKKKKQRFEGLLNKNWTSVL
jgi:hypothetical protein